MVYNYLFYKSIGFLFVRLPKQNARLFTIFKRIIILFVPFNSKNNTIFALYLHLLLEDGMYRRCLNICD